jgi:hypothetical protein
LITKPRTATCSTSPAEPSCCTSGATPRAASRCICLACATCSPAISPPSPRGNVIVGPFNADRDQSRRSIGRLAGTGARIAAREDDAPEAIAAQRNWRKIVAAAALQGAVEGTRKLTGIWPGAGGQQPGKEA